MGAVEYKVQIHGEVTPRTLPLTELFDVLRDMEAAIVATASSRGDAVDPKDPITLDRVGEGSAIPHVRVPEQFRASADEVHRAIKGDDFTSLPMDATDALLRLQQRNRELGRFVSFIEPGGEAARLTTKSSVPEASTHTVCGLTTVYGHLRTLGGKKPFARLVRLNGDVVRAQLSEKLLLDLRDHLREEVGLRGVATWDPRTKKMTHLEVREVMPYRHRSILEAFDEIADLLGDQFEGVDAVEFVESQRGRQK